MKAAGSVSQPELGTNLPARAMWLVGMGTFPPERKVRRRLTFQGLTMTMECFVRNRYKEKLLPIDSIPATFAVP